MKYKVFAVNRIIRKPVELEDYEKAKAYAKNLAMEGNEVHITWDVHEIVFRGCEDGVEEWGK